MIWIRYEPERIASAVLRQRLQLSNRDRRTAPVCRRLSFEGHGADDAPLDHRSPPHPTRVTSRRKTCENCDQLVPLSALGHLASDKVQSQDRSFQNGQVKGRFPRPPRERSQDPSQLPQLDFNGASTMLLLIKRQQVPQRWRSDTPAKNPPVTHGVCPVEIPDR